MSRVPRDLADIVKDLAENNSVTYSDWIAEAIAAKAGFELPADFIQRPGNDHRVQEEIPMQNAS